MWENHYPNITILIMVGFPSCPGQIHETAPCRDLPGLGFAQAPVAVPEMSPSVTALCLLEVTHFTPPFVWKRIIHNYMDSLHYAAIIGNCALKLGI